MTFVISVATPLRRVTAMDSSQKTPTIAAHNNAK
jgi:hypothetical protein